MEEHKTIRLVGEKQTEEGCIVYYVERTTIYKPKEINALAKLCASMVLDNVFIS